MFPHASCLSLVNNGNAATLHIHTLFFLEIGVLFASVLHVILATSPRHPEAPLSTVFTERAERGPRGRQGQISTLAQSRAAQSRLAEWTAEQTAEQPLGAPTAEFSGGVLIPTQRQHARRYSEATGPVRNGHQVETGRGPGGGSALSQIAFAVLMNGPVICLSCPVSASRATRAVSLQANCGLPSRLGLRPQDPAVMQ